MKNISIDGKKKNIVKKFKEGLNLEQGNLMSYKIFTENNPQGRLTAFKFAIKEAAKEFENQEGTKVYENDQDILNLKKMIRSVNKL